MQFTPKQQLMLRRALRWVKGVFAERDLEVIRQAIERDVWTSDKATLFIESILALAYDRSRLMPSEIESLKAQVLHLGVRAIA